MSTNPSLDNTTALLEAVQGRVRGRQDWEAALQRIIDTERTERAHLVIMHEPYLSHVLAGRKKVESRFSRHCIAPFNQVEAGDVLLLKSLGGPVSAVAQIQHVESYVLDPIVWASIKDRFALELCIEDEKFWDDRRDAHFATLMRLGPVLPIDPLAVDKRDRRSWVVLMPLSIRQAHRGQLGLLEDDGTTAPRRTVAPANGANANHVESVDQLRFHNEHP